MANGTDPILDEIRGIGGSRSGTALAEPEEADPVLSEIRNIGKAQREATARAHVTPTTSGLTLDQPTTPSPTQRGAQVGAPMIPMEPPGTLPPHMVRGLFGQPTDPEMGVPERELTDEQYQTQQETERQRQQESGIPLGPLDRIARAIAQHAAQPAQPPGMVAKALAPGVPGQMGVAHPEIAQSLQALLGARVPLEAGGPQGPDVGSRFARGTLAATSSLFTPENAALLASMEGLPAAGRAILGALFTPQFFLGTLDNATQIVDAFKKKDWGTAAEALGNAVPTIAFTAEGLQNIVEGSQRAYEGIQQRGARKAGAEAAEEATAEPQNVITVSARRVEPTEEQPEVQQPTRRAPRARRAAAPQEAPTEAPEIPEQVEPIRKGRIYPEPTPASEPEKGEVGAQVPQEPPTPESTSGEPEIPAQPINPQEVADLEQELGRPVRAEDVNAIRRRQATEANIEAGLRGERGDEAARIREEHRAGLEDKTVEEIRGLSAEPAGREPGEESQEQPTAAGSEVPTEPPRETPMEHAPPGGWTEADKVPASANKSTSERMLKKNLKAVDVELVSRAQEKARVDQNDHMQTLIGAMVDKAQKWPYRVTPADRQLLNDYLEIPKGSTFNVEKGKVTPESATLPAEAPADEQPTEPRAEERPDIRTQPVGAAGEGPLETVPSEDVRGTPEERITASESGEGGGADRERLAEHGESGIRPSGSVGSSEGEIPVPTERGRGAEPGPKPGQLTAGNRRTHDYRITEADALGSGGERTKYRSNVSAIRTLKQIESEGRLATPEEQQALVKYTGWGGIAPNQLFNERTQGGGKWADQYRELKELLTPDEYTRARASTTNAHYTSAPVVERIWDALRHLGFEEGRVLEPGAGIGHFLGLEPADLAANSRRTAVELDPVSGRILKQLYQSADVRVQDFVDFKAPNNSYDAVVGNVPFGAAKMYDPAYKDRLSVHNYFIVKSLDKLRPGGVAALITSHHTLDAIDPAAKKMISDRADLLGAIRLPNTAFKGNAGTEVTTDILFFRKRAPDEATGGKPFSSIKEITSPKGSKINVNQYFAENPDMMLGDMELEGTMRAAGEPALIPRAGQDLSAELEKAIGKLPEKAMKPREVPDAATMQATEDSIPDFRETKPYGLAIKGGKVFRRLGDAMEELTDYPKNTVSALKEMLGLRDTARELLKAEAGDLSQTQLDDLRRRLNNSYDRFTKNNGLIHSPRNEKAMHADPDLPLLLSLESFDKKTKTAKKADIFNKRVISPIRTIEKADTAKDAMLVSLGEKGRIDFNRMADLTGKSVQELEAELKSDGLAFHSPDGQWEPSDVYLSGNVRKKLAAAQEAAKTDEEYKANVQALEAVIPQDLPPSQISVRLGASWIPRNVVRDFVAHVLDAPFPERIRVGHIESKGMWTLEGYGFAASTEAQMKWGTKRMSPQDLIEDGLNQRVPIVWDKGADDKRVINQVETEAAKQKLSDLNDEFKRWLFEESPHADPMTKEYNERFNAEVEWKPDGSHLTLPGSSAGITLRPWQKDAIWRGVSGKNNLLLAHEVGLGKTFILHGIAMEWRRLGLKKKPMIVVPTNLVEQNRQDFLKLYPSANVLAADPDSFSKDNRKEFMSRIATGDWDSVIVGDSQFGLLPASPALYQRFKEEQLSAARQQLAEVKTEGGNYRTVKEVENQIADLEGDIEELTAKQKKDQITPFDELGVDGLLVDEAHRMKSLWFQTKMGRVRGVPRNNSKRAMDAYIKSRYVTELNNGNGIVFSTGTPITNTIAEAWILQKFLDEGMLKDMGMEHFDSWAANFGQSVTKAEGFPENPSKLRMMTRFSQFNNIPELSRLFHRIADVKFADDVGLPRPKMAGGKMVPHVVQPSESLLDYIGKLVERAKAVRGRPPEPGGDNMLVITNDGRKAAIDMRMVDSNAGDDPDSKLNQAARLAAEKYHETRDNRTTQLLMLDLREGAGSFDAYQEIRAKLVSMGVPKDEIKFIQDYKTSEKKQGLFNDVNDGRVAIVLGSTETLGVGVNVQKRLGKLIHIDAPWRPDGIEQRNGRAIRQGNTNPEVEVTPMVTEKSFDAYLWDLLKRKSDFITAFLKGDPSVRSMEDVGARNLNFDEIQAIASGDPRIFEKMEAESELQRLESLAKAHADQQFDNKARLARLPEQIEGYRERAAAIEEDIKTRDTNKLEKFGITVNKKHYAERKDAGQALNDELQKFRGEDGNRSVGDYAGFRITIHGDSTGHVQGNMAYPFKMGLTDEREPSAIGTIQSVEGAIRTLEDKLKTQQELATKFTKEMADRKKEVGKPFAQQKKLDELNDRLQTLTKELGIDKTQDEGPEDKEEESPDDLTMSFMGLQGLYNKLARLMKGIRSRPPKGEEEAPPEEAPNVPPYVDELRDLQTGVAERAANIRLDKLRTSDDVLNLIRQTAKQHAARIASQRRGKLSDKELKQRMEDVGLDPEKLAKLKKGTALNEAEMQVAIGIMLDKGEQVRAAQKAAQEDNSTANLLRAQQMHNEYVAIQAAVSGAKAESGRALRIQRMISEAFRSQNRSDYERVIDSLGGRELTEKERDKLLQIPAEDRIGYYKFLRDHARFTTPQKIVAYWMNNILSSPHTVLRKTLGDAAMFGLSVPERFARASIDPLMARMQRRTREFYMRDAVAQTAAYVGSIPEGIKAGAFMLWNGFDLQDAEELDMPYRYELPGGLAMNWPTRLLGAATAMFKTMHYKSALAGEAMRIALKEGLEGRTAGTRAAELADNPTEDMVSKAWEEARTLSLVEKPDQTLRTLLNFRERFLRIPQGVPVVGGLSPMRFVVPFATVGWNIAKNAARYSPLGVARLAEEETRKGPEASKVVAQAVIGSLIMAMIANWAAQGNLTGSAPKSPQDRDAFFRSGKQAYSFKVGNHWVRYTAGWGPVALMAGAVAGWYDAFKDKNVAPGWEQIGQVAAALGNAITDQTFFRGLQNLDEAITNPSRYGSQWVSEIASGFVPFSGFDRTFAESLDPDIRDPQGIAERVKGGLPILSESVPPRLDTLGRPIERRGGTGAAAFLPAPMPEDKPESDVDAELARLNEKGLRNPGFVSRFLTLQNQKIPMSRGERDEYQTMRGTLLRGMLDRVFSNPEYKALTDEEKIDEVNEVVRQVESYAREQMMGRVVNRRLGREESGVPMEAPN
jgi:N12 class adenine-specific DNA methylase